MSDQNITYRILNEKMMHILVDDLIEIDEEEVLNNKIEAWSKYNFLKNLKDKFILSVVIYYSNEILGYRIVSGESKHLNYAHGHRFVIKNAFQKKGFGKILLKISEGILLNNNYSGISTFISNQNIISQKFFTANGYRITEISNNNNRLFLKDLSIKTC